MASKTSVILKHYFLSTVGCLLYAVGVALFLAPNNLASGGVTGISILITKFFDILPIGTLVMMFNVPIMIIGIWKLGFKILVPTLYALGASSLFMNLLEAHVSPLTTNPLLACTIGAAIASAGIGFVFRGGATTGGTDIIVKVLRLKYKHLSTGSIFLVIDGAIVLVSGFVFKDVDTALYAALALFVQMYVLNTVLYGSDEARMVYIISDSDTVIAEKLLIELDVGATYLNGSGAYTGKDKKVLMCAMKMRILPQAREIVRAVDSDAFMIVTKATSVFGEGFKNHNEEDL